MKYRWSGLSQHCGCSARIIRVHTLQGRQIQAYLAIDITNIPKLSISYTSKRDGARHKTCHPSWRQNRRLDDRILIGLFVLQIPSVLGSEIFDGYDLLAVLWRQLPPNHHPPSRDSAQVLSAGTRPMSRQTSLREEGLDFWLLNPRGEMAHNDSYAALADVLEDGLPDVFVLDRGSAPRQL